MSTMATSILPPLSGLANLAYNFCLHIYDVYLNLIPDKSLSSKLENRDIEALKELIITLHQKRTTC